MGYVYLLTFDQPISDKHTTQSYCGWAKDLRSRIGDHRRGCGARLTQVTKERGIGFQVARVWVGSRKTERRIKNLKNGRRLATGQANVRFAPELSQSDIEFLLQESF